MKRMAWAALLIACVAATGFSCRKILSQDKVETFRMVRTAAIVWEVENRESGPDLMRETAVRILREAGHEIVDPGRQRPDLLVHITLRGSHTYETPKPNDYWMSGEVSLLGPRGKVYEKHFYGDTIDLEAAFYAEDSFYEKFLLMVSRIYGPRVAEAEVTAMKADARFSGRPRDVLERLATERRRD